MWVLTKKFKIPMIQFTDYMKLNKKKGSSVEAPIPLRKWKKRIMGGRGREEPGWERGENKGRFRYERRQERIPESQENEHKYALVWGGEQGKQLESLRL